MFEGCAEQFLNTIRRGKETCISFGTFCLKNDGGDGIDCGSTRDGRYATAGCVDGDDYDDDGHDDSEHGECDSKDKNNNQGWENRNFRPAARNPEF